MREWQRLLVQHRLNHDIARYGGIDPIGRDHVPAVGYDGVGVLHDLEPLEMVVVVQAHAGADNVENIDDPERPVALMRAQFPMIDVVDRNQRVNAGRLRGFQFGKL